MNINANDVRNVPELLDCLSALKENAVSNQNYPVAVMWREIRAVIVEYNDSDASQTKQHMKAVANNLRLVAQILCRFCD